jgi:hypothetical protein
MKTEITGQSRGRAEEERAFGESCGEMPNVFDKARPGIPHADYRVLVMRAALKLSSKPTTKDFALAKAHVDRELASQGIGVVIPAARPSRRTI